MPLPKMDRRIDYFAMAAMEAIVNLPDFEKRIKLRAKHTGLPIEELVAIWAYEFAVALEAEAETH